MKKLIGLLFIIIISSCQQEITPPTYTDIQLDTLREWVNTSEYAQNSFAIYQNIEGLEKRFIIDEKFDNRTKNIDNQEFVSENYDLILTEENNGEFELSLKGNAQWQNQEPNLVKIENIYISLRYTRLEDWNLAFAFNPILQFVNGEQFDGVSEYFAHIDIAGKTYKDVFVQIEKYIDTTDDKSYTKRMFFQKGVGLLAFEYESDFYVFNRFE